jgi:hypothetical protein
MFGKLVIVVDFVPWAIGLAVAAVALALVFFIRNWNRKNRRDE